MPKNNDLVLASVLKPVQDPRLYHKLGKSIEKLFPQLAIKIWAFCPSLPPPAQGNIQFHALFTKNRLHLQRLGANYRLYQALKEKPPKVLIISTWELIPAAYLLKKRKGTKILYDVRENYAANLRYTKIYPPWIRNLLAWGLRYLEKKTQPHFQHYFLAERVYAEEMPFMKPAIFLENKCSQEILQARDLALIKKPRLQFLYSGTISQNYGLKILLDWFEQLRKDEPESRLSIYGFAPVKKEQAFLRAWASKRAYIDLKGIESSLPYPEIVEAIHQADWLLMPYQVGKNVAGRIPTKFYEALALGKKMLIQKNPFWEAFLAEKSPQSAYFLDFTQKEWAFKEWKKAQEKLVLSPKILREDVFWEEQEAALASVIAPLLNS